MRHRVPILKIRSLDHTVDYPLRLVTAAAWIGNVHEALHVKPRCTARLTGLVAQPDAEQSRPADIAELLLVCKAAGRMNVPYVRVFGGG